MANRCIITANGSPGTGRFASALLAATALMVAVPGTGLAFGGIGGDRSLISQSFSVFTPADVDPQLARRVALDLSGKNMRFTPAGSVAGQDRTITVAVRVDNATARAISVRSGGAAAVNTPGSGPVKVASTRYNLGISRGYRSFPVSGSISGTDNTGLAVSRTGSASMGTGSAAATALPAGIRKLDMPDLAQFKPRGGSGKDKPGRFQPRIALETEQGSVGRTPVTRDALGEQSVDVGGAYRVSRNLDVTAGVRLSQERDRLAPLTDSVQDSQAVYVGTKVRF